MNCSLPGLLRPWDFPGKSTGVGCHCLLQIMRSVINRNEIKKKKTTLFSQQHPPPCECYWEDLEEGAVVKILFSEIQNSE